MRTWRDLELWSKADVLADFDHVADVGIVQETFEVQDQDRWQRFDELLPLGLEHLPRPCWRCDLHWVLM